MLVLNILVIIAIAAAVYFAFREDVKEAHHKDKW